MFYKYIDKDNITLAPHPLKVNGRDIFTTDEKIYNEYGYYRLEREDYPQDEKQYSPYYELADNIIYQKWEEIEIPDVVEDELNE